MGGRRSFLFNYACALLLCALIAVTTVGFGWHLHAQAAGLGSWSCDTTQPASVAFKADNFTNALGGVATGLPGSALAIVGNDFRHRAWLVYLYPGDVTVTFFWDSATVESTQPGGFPTGRFDPTGNPIVAYHDATLKAFSGVWGGEGNGDVALYRVRFPCTFRP
jgi:hypothetical protein